MDELQILQSIHSISSPVLDDLMMGVTYVAAKAAIWLILGVVMMCTDRYRRTGVAVIVSICAVYIVCDLLMKPMFARDRPCDLADSPLLVPIPDSYSFPSGHTASSFAAATAVFISCRRAGVPAMLFAAMVGFSRLYLFVHWPTDVVAGAAVGSIIAVVCVWSMRRWIPYFGDASLSGDPDP